MSEIKMLDLDRFSFGTDIMTREVLEWEPLDLFRELYREEGPEALPPVVVFHDADDVFWVADGHYRIVAARDALSKNGPRVLPADVREGTKRDAILFACGANAKHGQPLAAHEKRTVVRRLLKDAEWSQWSDRQIARYTGTSHTFVGGMRKALEQEAQAASGNSCQIAAPTRTVQRGGTTYPMHTANIGHASGTPAAPTSNVDDDDHDDGMEAVITEGLDGLHSAWREANDAARRTFLDWAVTQPIGSYGPVTPSEETQCNSARIANACRSTALIAALAPEGFVYIPDFLSHAEQNDLLEILRALTYEHAVFRGQTMKRAWAQFGFHYVATSRKLEAAPPIPPFLQAVIDKAAPYYPTGIEFAQCIVTKYPPKAGIEWHTDASPFGDCILGVSLASEARLQFRPTKSDHAPYEVRPCPGSLYVMQGNARWHYEHRLMPVKEERYSLTFRTVV